MKRIAVIFVIAFFALSLAACGNSQISNSSFNDSSIENITNSEDDLTEHELASIVADKLGVPEKVGITYVIGEKIYWDAGGVYFKQVEFYENSELVAGACVDPRNGELLRNIHLYTDGEE